MRITSLADHLDLAPMIATAVWTEWGYASAARCAADLRATRATALPIAYVSLEDDAPVGIVSLIECNLPERCDLTPWLAGLYVWPAHRNRGIGTALTRTVERGAKRLGYDRLYLYTAPAEQFYDRLGWETISRDELAGAAIAIMVRRLADPS